MSLKDLRDRLERGISIAPSLSERLIERLTPVIQLEDLIGLDESDSFDVRFCAVVIGLAAGAGDFAAANIFNPVGSGSIGVVTGYAIASSNAGDVLFAGTTEADFGTAGADPQLRDARIAGSPTLTSGVRATTVFTPDRILYQGFGALSLDRSRQNPVAIVGPGMGFAVANQIAGAHSIRGFIEWTELVRKQAPGP